jgi:hypothetical protein
MSQRQESSITKGSKKSTKIDECSFYLTQVNIQQINSFLSST